MLSILFENAPRKESNIGRNLAILGGLGALGAGGAILGSNLNKSSTTPVATSNTKNSVLPSNSDASIQTKDPNSYKQFMTNANDAHLRQSDGSIGSYTGPHLGDVIDAQERKQFFKDNPEWVKNPADSNYVVKYAPWYKPWKQDEYLPLNNLNAKPVTRDEFIRLMSNKNSPEYNAWHGIVQPSTTHIPAGEEFGDAPYYQISSEGGRSGYVFNIDGQKVYLDSNNVSDPDESYRKLYNSVKMPELIDKTQKWEDHERVQGALNQLNLQRNDDLLYQASKAIASTQNIPYGQEFDAGSPVTTYSETPTELPPEVQNVVDQSLGKTTVDNIGDQLKVPPLRNTEDGSLDRGIHARPEVFMNPPNQNIVRPSPFGPKETNIPMGTPVPAMSNVG